MQIRFVQPDGAARVIEMQADESVMACARREAVPGILGECGGAMMCGTCHVYVAAECFDFLPQPSPQELDLVSGCIEPRETSRLGCQIRWMGGLDVLTVTVPVSQV